jgi:hypothetical protein
MGDASEEGAYYTGDGIKHYPPGTWELDKPLPTTGDWYVDGQFLIRQNGDGSLDEVLT